MPIPQQKTPDRRISRRQKALRAKMSRRGFDAFLITNPHNVRYFCGFTGDDSWVVLTAGRCALLTDSRYTEQARSECCHCDVLERKGSLHALCRQFLSENEARIVGFESDAVTYRLWSLLQGDGLEWQPSTGLVESQRMTKDPEEVRRIGRAISVAQAAFLQVRELIKPGVTEVWLANKLDAIQRQLGASGSSFEPIVLFGERASLPHGRPSERVLKEGEQVLIDWGARVGLYDSDLTRVLLPSKISGKLRRIYQIVLDAQRAAIDAAKPGMSGRQLDAVARKVIEKAHYGKAFGHGLGHGVGLEIHEGPVLSRFSTDELKPGMVVTIEPGIYIPGWGGVRIEDMILITRTGRRVLTSLPKSMDEVCVI